MLNASDSSFSGFSDPLGGALDNLGTATIVNCTFTGNSGLQGQGGAIFNNGTLDIIQSTLTRNSAAIGGAIYSLSSKAKLVLDNTIVAGNTLKDGTTPSDVYGAGVTGSNNLIGTGGSGGLTNGVNGNIVGVADPKLAPLGDYGGPTQTMPPLPGSPAIDAGSNALAVGADGKPLPTDQRGYYRIFNHTVDIGAVESGSVPLLPGDANADGKVGFADLLLVARNYGMTSASWADGDFNADGSVGFDDLVIVARNYGKSVSLTASAAVSESATITTLDTQPADELPRLGHVTRHRH